MNMIIRYWNQNRKVIIIGIIAIVLIITTIQVLNQMARNSIKQKNANRVVLTEEEKKLPTQSIIGGESTTVETAKENTQIINDFVQKCNNGEIAEAYKMLTDECKEIVFPTEESFRTGYINLIFKEKKNCDAQNFLGDVNRQTYLVKFANDVLASGNINDLQTYQDYITIDKNAKNGKLNINGFIYRKDINKEKEVEGIKVKVISQEVYKEKEKYNVKIENNTNKTILIDTGRKTRTTYAYGSNGTKYNSNITDISSALREIFAKVSQDYKIEVRKPYSSGVYTELLVFSDIVTDYEQYLQDPSNFDERVQISINI